MRGLGFAVAALLLAACGSDSTPGSAEPPAPETIRLDVDRVGGIRLDGETRPRADLISALAAYADVSREDRGDRLSAREVRIVADPATPYRALREALWLCADPGVRVSRIRLRAGDRSERLELEGMFVRSEVFVDRRVFVNPFLRSGEDGARIDLFGDLLRADDAGFAELEARCRDYLRDEPTLPAETDADPEVETRYLLRLLEALRRAGFAPPRIVGVPPLDARGWGRREVDRALSDLSGDARLARLEELARSPLRYTRVAAYEILLGLGVPAIPVCARLLRDPDPVPALGALIRIREDRGVDLGPIDLGPAWPAVLEAVRRSDPARVKVAELARDIAGRIGPAALEELEAVLSDLRGKGD